MRRLLLALQISIVVAALLVGGSVGYLIKPTSVIKPTSAVVVSIAPTGSDDCLFSGGEKLGC